MRTLSQANKLLLSRVIHTHWSEIDWRLATFLIICEFAFSFETKQHSQTDSPFFESVSFESDSKKNFLAPKY